MEEAENNTEAESEDQFPDDGVPIKSSSEVHPSITMDYRIAWVRERICKFLGLHDQQRLFDELLNENDRYNEDQLLNLLVLDLYGVTDLGKKQVFFYKTYHSEVIQEEIAVWEESHRAKISAITAFSSKTRPQRLTKSAPGKVEKVEEEKKDKRNKKAKKIKTGKSDSLKTDTSSGDTTSMATSSMAIQSLQQSNAEGSIDEHRSGSEEGEDEDKEEGEGQTGSGATRSELKPKSLAKSVGSLTSAFAPPPGDEDKYVLIKKMVDKVVQVSDLHMFFGGIDGNRTELFDKNLIYFLRTNEAGIPPFENFQECKAEMPDYIVVGSLNGRYLATMNKLLHEVFEPLVQTQFREPSTHQLREEDSILDERSKDEDKTSRKISAQSAAFAKPSNYRRISITAAKNAAARLPLSTQQQNDNDKVEEKIPTPVPDKVKKRHKKSSGSSRKSMKRAESSSMASGFDTKSNKSESSETTKKIEKQEDDIEPSKRDLLEALGKLKTSVAWTLEHTEGDILLTIPKIPELTDPQVTDEMFCADHNAIEQLEEVVMSWERHIQKIIDGYLNKVPQGKGPMAEYDYWRDRETGLSMIVEQMKTLAVKRILSLLSQASSQVSASIDYYQLDLWKYYSEARDNVTFLYTIMRYFKMIAESESFKMITEMIPSLMEGMKLIWVLSRYYCADDKIVPLLERIAWQLCQNVMKNLAVNKLFRRPLLEVLERTKEAHAMMKQWQIAYLSTREKIELSGKGTRWEFDKRRLFKETEYIANVCNDLNKVASVLQDFYNIFGAELKSIINDPAQIDAVVKRVDELVVPIQEADFNLFTVFNKENWEAMMTWFYSEVASLENEAKFFIDECFTVLISAQDALEMLLKFKDMKTRAAIQQQLLKKFDIVMQQFSKEINSVENIFNRGKRNPPLLRYHPPIAGAIFWERQLFHRLKGPVLIFQNVSELKHSDLKILAFGQYLSIAKQMKYFEDAKYTSWVKRAHSVIANTLNRNVLKITSYERDKGEQNTKGSLPKIRGIAQMTKGNKSGITVHQPTPLGSVQRNEVTISKLSSDTFGSGYGSKVVGVILNAKQRSVKPDRSVPGYKDKTSTLSTMSEKQPGLGASMNWKELMEGAILAEFQLRFEVNFNQEVFEIIREAELLEQLGFELPSVVRDAGVQKDRLHADIESTEKVINQFNEIIDKLDVADIQILKITLQSIEKCIQPGMTRLNWHSLGIADYAAGCAKQLKSLVSVIQQVNQMKQDLDKRIENELESYNLFFSGKETPKDSETLQSCKEYFVTVELKRTHLICAMLKAYNSAGPMLVKLESLVLGTSTGKSPSMQLYYEQYEYKIFSAFITCVVRNLDILNKILTGSKAVFQVNAILSASEVVIRPSPSEVYNIILHDVKDLLERIKAFPRWMSETCLECKPLKIENSEEHATFSFFEDIMSIQVINDLIISVQDTAHRLSIDLWKYLHRWKKYGNLWCFDKNQTCEKFAANNPTLLQYDEKFTFYGAIVQEVEEMLPYHDINSVRINLSPLLVGIGEHGNEWKQVLGNHLLADTIQSMNEFQLKMAKYRNDVELVINGLDRFKLVMQTIADVKKMSVQAEVQYREYQERFRTLRLHGIAFNKENEEMTYKLQQDWESLYLGALYRGTTLESTKDRFCEMTKEEINDFIGEFQEFAEKFEKFGPGSVGNDLDAGMKKMDEYGKLIEAMEAKRLDLVNAEILFDLPLADYSPFLKVKKDFEGMELLYKLYKAQKTARDGWAKALWANLNPQQLIDGMEQFMKEFRRFPRAVRMLNVGQALDHMMKSFKNSVPLFVELKNEAMRERHWKELMDKTGKHFDMAPDRFTLENMFAMDLARYQDIAEAIVNNAVKELAIEKGVKEIADVWKVMDFTVLKHYKGNP